MRKQFFLRRAIRFRDKRHFFIQSTIVGWVLLFASFGWIFAKHGASDIGFWLSFAAICLIGVFAWALLFWHFFVKPRIEHFARHESRTPRGP